MMSRDRHKRSTASRVYMITGVDEEEKAVLGKHIERLGSVYANSTHFQSNTTHVVCGKLSRSEKFLGALALGRWVVKPEYITDSLHAGKWLDEVDYEWSILQKGHDQVLASAAKRNRWRVSMSSDKIFADWQAAIALSDAKRQKVYKRLLVYGGAKVCDIKLPTKQPSKYCEQLSYLFLDRKTAPLAQPLQEGGVMCLNANYISDYIISDPQPDLLEYILKTSPSQTVHSGSAQGPEDDLDSSYILETSSSGSQILPDHTPKADTFKKEKDNGEMLTKSQRADSTSVADVIIIDDDDFQPEEKRKVVTSSSSSTTSTASTPSSPASRVAPSTSKSVQKKKRARDCGISVADVTEGIKKLKEDIVKRPTHQSFVSPKRVQSSLRDWFSPNRKENQENRGSAKGVAKPELIKKLENKLWSKPHDQSINSKMSVDRDSDHREVLLRSPGKDSGSASKCISKLDMTEPEVTGPTCVGLQSASDLTAVRSPAQCSAEFSLVSSQTSDVCVEAKGLSSISVSDCANHSSGSQYPQDICHSNDLSDSLTTCAASGKPVKISYVAPETLHRELSTSSDPSVARVGSADAKDQVKTLTVSSSHSEKTPTKKFSSVKEVINGIHKKDSAKLRTVTSSIKKARAKLTSSEDVLSARSLNKTKCSKKMKTRSAHINSFLIKLRERKKDSEKMDIVDQLSPQTSPVKAKSETVPAKRRKTIRGLTTSQTGASETVHIVQPETSKILNQLHVTSFVSDSSSLIAQSKSIKSETVSEASGMLGGLSVVETNTCSNSSSLNTVGPNSVSKRSVPLDVCVQSGNTSKHLTLHTRWQLSNVPLPGQFDLTQSSTHSLEEVMLKTHVPESLGDMICSCLDERYFQSAVGLGLSTINSCPTMEMFRYMVVVVKEAGNQMLVNQANAVLMSWLDQFPPITSTLRTLYEEALGLSDWEAVRSVLQNAVKEAETRPEEVPDRCPGSARLVLRLVIAVLEKNFLSFAHSASRQTRRTCLIIRCLWSPSYQVYPNGRTRDLLNFLETALKHPASPQACWQELLKLVSMAAQCCHLADNRWQWKMGGQVERCSGSMVQELAYTLTGGVMTSVAHLQQVLSHLSPPWLLRQVSTTLLNDYDDYLVHGGLTSDPITLKTIVTRYFFLLPRLSGHNSSESSTPRKKLQVSAVEKDENKAPPLDPKLSAEKINKRNPKGETMLHRAAIRNNISLLRQMLSVPGVDVNSQDNLGWTPLHEACNHGHLECAKALLQFKPCATLDSFFHTGRKRSVARRVDIRLANKEGITVLHDAVDNNHINVVKLLLKYGGSSLLHTKTESGDTPLDRASTEEMRQVLTRDVLDLNMSQGSFSQDIDCQVRQSLPTSFMYSEVVDSDDCRTHFTACLEDMHRFLTLLTMLLRSHLQILKDQQQLKQQRQQQCHPAQAGQQQQLLVEEEEEEADVEEWGEAALQYHVQALQRHVKNITTEDVYAQLTAPLCVLEALLTESCRR